MSENKIPMERYIGTKVIYARPMMAGMAQVKLGGTRGVSGKNENDEGYLVQYEDGYQSWSPKEVFDAAYRRCDAMTFGLALEAMKKGKKVARAGWNGKDMFVYLVAGNTIVREKLYHEARTHVYPVAKSSVDICSHIDMKAADGTIVVGWLASQTDMLAEDWSIVD